MRAIALLLPLVFSLILSIPGWGQTQSPPAIPTDLFYWANPATYGMNAPITNNVPTVSGAIKKYSVAPALPAGLKLDSNTGIISGTPTVLTASTNYTILAANSSGFTTAIVNITVTPSINGTPVSIGGFIDRATGLSNYCYAFLPPSGPCEGPREIIDLGPGPGAKVYLQNAATPSGFFKMADSIIADTNGVYMFHFSILDSGFYRILVPPQIISGDNYNADTGSILTMEANDSLTQNFVLGPIPTAVYHGFQNRNPGIRFSINGDRLLLDFDASKSLRTIEIYNPAGSLQRRVNVPVGETQISLPGAFAPQKGFLYRVH